jgi:hypothetical protein
VRRSISLPDVRLELDDPADSPGSAILLTDEPGSDQARRRFERWAEKDVGEAVQLGET